MPTAMHVQNVKLNVYDGDNLRAVFISESALGKLRGIDWEAIVIDEFDQFSDPAGLLREVMVCNAHVYICGTPKKGIGIGALALLALKLHTCKHTVFYKTPEIAQEMEESYKLICAIWGEPNVHIDER